jgi:hypothetical protein
LLKHEAVLVSEKKMSNEQKSYGLRASLAVLEKMGRGDRVLAKALRDAIQQPAQSQEIVVTAAMFGEISISRNSRTSTDQTDKSTEPTEE